MPTFLKIVWRHDLADEPTVLYSRLDEDRYEVREVEVFRDGRRVWADSDTSTGECVLGGVPAPRIPDLEASGEFSAVEIEEAEFEAEWAAARAGDDSST